MAPDREDTDMTTPPGTPGPQPADATQSLPAPPAPGPDPVPPPAGPAPAWRPTAPASLVPPSAPPAQAWPPPDPTHPARPAAPPPYGPGAAAPPPYGPGPGPAPAPAAPPAPRRRGPLRILGRAVVVLVILGALAGTTAWGFTNRASAERWRDRSRAADADLERALARVEATSAEVDDARQRLRDLAAEKAGETDQNRILSDIVAAAPEVTAAMRDCQQETTDLANDIIAQLGVPEPDVAGLQERADQVNATCGDALEQAGDLEAAIDELGL